MARSNYRRRGRAPGGYKIYGEEGVHALINWNVWDSLTPQIKQKLFDILGYTRGYADTEWPIEMRDQAQRAEEEFEIRNASRAYIDDRALKRQRGEDEDEL